MLGIERIFCHNIIGHHVDLVQASSLLSCTQCEPCWNLDVAVVRLSGIGQSDVARSVKIWAQEDWVGSWEADTPTRAVLGAWRDRTVNAPEAISALAETNDLVVVGFHRALTITRAAAGAGVLVLAELTVEILLAHAHSGSVSHGFAVEIERGAIFFNINTLILGAACRADRIRVQDTDLADVITG